MTITVLFWAVMFELGGLIALALILVRTWYAIDRLVAAFHWQVEVNRKQNVLNGILRDKLKVTSIENKPN